jgi:hypothetical protein
VPRVVEVPDAVRVTATAAGAPGRRWLASLGDLLAELEEVGDVTVGDTMSGGAECLVAEARLATGRLSLKEGHTEWAHAHLAVAEAWALA